MANKGKKSLATSKAIYAKTGSGKGNPQRLTVSTTLSLKAGKSAGISASLSNNGSTKVFRSKALSFESSDKSVAKVSAMGKVSAVRKGKCKIYVFAQNGLYKAINVTVS